MDAMECRLLLNYVAFLQYGTLKQHADATYLFEASRFCGVLHGHKTFLHCRYHSVVFRLQ